MHSVLNMWMQIKVHELYVRYIIFLDLKGAIVQYHMIYVIFLIFFLGQFPSDKRYMISCSV